MNELKNLVIKYKKTKSKQILNDIFDLLKSIIEKKAKFIYYKKYFPVSLYHNNNKKGTFNLFKSYLCEYVDVEQDLNMEIMRLINDFNIKKDFKTYLFSSLWMWIPSFINKNFVETLHNVKLYSSDSDGRESGINIPANKNIEKNFVESKIKDLLKELDNSIDKKILLNLLNKKDLTQIKIAKKLGITQQRVSQIIIKIKKLLK